MSLGNFSEVYEFGPFRLNASERELSRDDAVLPLTAKAFDVLFLLVRNSGRTVTREEFMSEVWAGTVVEEANLSDNISTLRQVLQDDARDPKYIQTVPKRGYRFVAEVRAVAPRPGDVERRWLPWTLGAAILIALAIAAIVFSSRREAHTQSLAVLPFKPLIPADHDPALEMGMTDALIAKLSRVRGLSVRPTTSVMPYAEKTIDIREVASKLDVDTMLDGKLQRSGDRVRVSVQLVRASDGSTIWADRYDERFTDIFALQDAISERVASSLRVRLTSNDRESLHKRYTDNVEAYQLYLNGLHEWRTFTPDGLLAAVNYQRAAIKLDPGYALAWAGLSKAYNVLGIWGSVPAREAFPKSRAAALKAVALDPKIAETHIPLLAVKLLYERDWEGARREIATIERLDPSLTELYTLHGYYFQAMGRPDLALPQLRRARDAAPDWEVAKNDALQALVEARRFDEAIAEAQKTIAIDPRPSTPHWVLGDALAGKGDFAAAIPPLEDAVFHREGAPSRNLGTLAWVYAKTGHREKALQLIETMKKERTPWVPMAIAEAYAGLGDHDAAFAWLNRACDELFPFVWDVKQRHEFDAIRNDPRYAQVLARIKLTP